MVTQQGVFLFLELLACKVTFLLETAVVLFEQRSKDADVFQILGTV